MRLRTMARSEVLSRMSVRKLWASGWFRTWTVSRMASLAPRDADRLHQLPARDGCRLRDFHEAIRVSDGGNHMGTLARHGSDQPFLRFPVQIRPHEMTAIAVVHKIRGGFG